RSEFGLPLGAAITLEQCQVVAMFLLHDLVDQQQAIAEIRIECGPVATALFCERTDLLDLGRCEDFRRQCRRWNQLLSLEKCLDLGVARRCPIVENKNATCTEGHAQKYRNDE